MKHKSDMIIYGEEEDIKEPKVRKPIKLSPKDIKGLTVAIAGNEFIDTGYALACPKCGKISGVSCREDIDHTIDFFFKFGCTHYNK